MMNVDATRETPEYHTPHSLEGADTNRYPTDITWREMDTVLRQLQGLGVHQQARKAVGRRLWEHEHPIYKAFDAARSEAQGRDVSFDRGCAMPLDLQQHAHAIFQLMGYGSDQAYELLKRRNGESSSA